MSFWRLVLLIVLPAAWQSEKGNTEPLDLTYFNYEEHPITFQPYNF